MDRGVSRSAALALTLLLAGCGGGGGAPVSSTPTPPVATVTPPDQPTTPTPTTPTPPAPPTANYDDAEYRRSTVAVAAGALTAYNAGATGAGVKIAILDSGLSDPTGQFSGRIDPASRDMVASRGITDQSGHGTSVAGVAAAGRNGSAILGVAFDATVTVLRSDNVGTCASSDGCTFSDTTLAQAIDYARMNGARVINMSLGGASPGTQFRAAIGRATAAGVVVVMSAGNDSAADPDAFAQIASSADANGLVVIAGAHDASGVIASFSDRAGAFGRYYLTALGSGVRSIDESGTIFQFAGTSYSAPAIAGAVALLAQAFPTMTGAQILALLYRTATDAGAAGVDGVYGNGILNLDRAFQPIGTTSLAGSAVPIDLTANAVLGTAMGDAGTRAAAGVGRATILDSFGRAYALDIGGTIGRRTGARPLIAAIGGDVRGAATTAGPFSASITLRRGSAGGQPWLGFAQRGMGREDERAARAIAGLVTARIDPATTVAFGFGQGSAALGRTMDQAAAPALLIARDPGETPGFEARRGAAIAVRRAIGAVALTVTAERGTVAARDVRYPPSRVMRSFRRAAAGGADRWL